MDWGIIRGMGRFLRLAGMVSLMAWLAVGAQGQMPMPVPSAASAKGDDGAPAFDVFSIRASGPDAKFGGVQWGLPDGFRSRGMTLDRVMVLAYLPMRWFFGNFAESRFVGVPAWAKTEAYDIEAKVAAEDQKAWQGQGVDKPLMHAMLQQALADRCKVVFHREMIDAPVYALVVAKRKPELKESDPGASMPADVVALPGSGRFLRSRRGEAPGMRFLGTSMEELAAFLSQSSARPVVDKTGLTGRYDFPLQQREKNADGSSDPDAPTIWEIDGTGLKLVAMKAPVETVVIDHMERPTPN